MSLLYKDDWEPAKERYRAWWAGECIGRCALAVTAPRSRPPAMPAPRRPQTAQECWWDLDSIAARNDYRMARTFYGGEALPVWSGGYPGHTAIPAFLGCPTTLDVATGTGWWAPILMGDALDVRSLRIDENSRYLRFQIELLKRGVAEARGKCLVSLGAFGGGGDTLAALRGTEQLLMDCADQPEAVRAAEEHLMSMWIEVYDRFYSLAREANDGSVCWFGVWSPGKTYAAQNDFSFSIGPRMFRDIFLSAIRRQTEFLDDTVYHVDGVCAFAHVDALCELPRLQSLQILPGAGQGSPLMYMDVLKKVQSAGKGLHITLACHEVEKALSQLSARGLFIATSCATEEDARKLLRDAERWSRDR